jgi:hypothetical protein
MVFLILLVLACGPFNRLQELNHKGRVLATGVATISEGNYSAFEAYEKLYRLPGYHLESRNTIRDAAGNISNATVSSQRDAQGNTHTLAQMPDGQQIEIYVVAGRTYVYDSRYEGWLDPNTLPAAERTNQDILYRFEANQFSLPLQLLPQFGAVPTETNREVIEGRAAIRYELDYVIGQLTKTFAARLNNSAELEGAIWIDEETGALLKAEIRFYEDNATYPNQEFVLEISQIGNIAPINLPAPPISPQAVISATATAQAWSALQIKINYQDEPVDFEVIPVQISQAVGNSAKPTAHLLLSLRQLPPHLLVQPDTELFLTQLRRQLTLSIPSLNMIVNSTGFQIEKIDRDNQTIEVIYFFESALEDFNYVELILSGLGNPTFAPVPVSK